MNQLKIYKRNGYEFQVVERIGNVARAVGRKGKSEIHDVFTIIPFDHHELQCPPQGISSFDNEDQAREMFLAMQQATR